jgi:hypothetical protein
MMYVCFRSFNLISVPNHENGQSCMYVLHIYSTLQVYQRSYSQVRHIPPKISDKFESQHSLSPTIWSDIMVGLFNLFTYFDVPFG